MAGSWAQNQRRTELKTADESPENEFDNQMVNNEVLRNSFIFLYERKSVLIDFYGKQENIFFQIYFFV